MASPTESSASRTSAVTTPLDSTITELSPARRFIQPSRPSRKLRSAVELAKRCVRTLHQLWLRDKREAFKTEKYSLMIDQYYLLIDELEADETLSSFIRNNLKYKLFSLNILSSIQIITKTYLFKITESVSTVQRI